MTSTSGWYIIMLITQLFDQISKETPYCVFKNMFPFRGFCRETVTQFKNSAALKTYVTNFIMSLFILPLPITKYK